MLLGQCPSRLLVISHVFPFQAKVGVFGAKAAIERSEGNILIAREHFIFDIFCISLDVGGFFSQSEDMETTLAAGTPGVGLDALVASFNDRVHVLRNLTLVRNGEFRLSIPL